jgi:DNA repair protein RecO (recombination protein O)
MEWSDDGFVISTRKHGEAAAIVSLLTREHGRHAGLVRGGAGRRQRGTLQIGNNVRATWRARLPEHLGNFTCELTGAHAAGLLDLKMPLLALGSAAALLETALPERAPHPEMYERFGGLVEALSEPGWETVYGRWEVELLADLGFGLDLSECAATGDNDNLVYVSPRTARAVSADAGEPYRDKLLALPPFLLDRESTADGPRFLECLTLTGHFLATHVFAPDGRDLPPARLRLVDALAGATTISSGSNRS